MLKTHLVPAASIEPILEKAWDNESIKARQVVTSTLAALRNQYQEHIPLVEVLTVCSELFSTTNMHLFRIQTTSTRLTASIAPELEEHILHQPECVDIYKDAYALGYRPTESISLLRARLHVLLLGAMQAPYLYESDSAVPELQFMVQEELFNCPVAVLTAQVMDDDEDEFGVLSELPFFKYEVPKHLGSIDEIAIIPVEFNFQGDRTFEDIYEFYATHQYFTSSDELDGPVQAALESVIGVTTERICYRNPSLFRAILQKTESIHLPLEDQLETVRMYIEQVAEKTLQNARVTQYMQ